MANINEVTAFARSKMNEHGLTGWIFQYDRATQRFGVCKYGPKVISLSEKLVRANSLEQCQDTALHEIAHALAGHKAGHGPAWKAQCRLIGAKPERCYSSADVVVVAKYRAFCEHCGDKVKGTRQQAPTGRYTCPTHKTPIVWKDARGNVVGQVAKNFVQQCDCGHVFAAKARNSSKTWKHNGCGGTVRINYAPQAAALQR